MVQFPEEEKVQQRQMSQLEKEKEKAELIKLEENNLDPYDFLDFRMPDGTIEIQSLTKTDKPPTKFNFYTVNLNERALIFSWSDPNLIRTRFEQLKR